MIAVLENEDPLGYPFWVSKVIKVIKENEDITAIEEHWYATSTYPFNGVYKTEMIVENKMVEREKEREQI